MKILVDVFGIFRAELWLFTIVLVHIIHREQRRGKRLAQLLPFVLDGRTSWLLWDIRDSCHLDDWTRLWGGYFFLGHRCFERGFGLSSFLGSKDKDRCCIHKHQDGTSALLLQCWVNSSRLYFRFSMALFIYNACFRFGALKSAS